MSVQAARKPISVADWVKANPLKDITGIGRVIVDYVGQGDAISIADLAGQTVMRIDYGGRESRPFARPIKQRLTDIELALPVAKGTPIFLTHWDEDHWCSALVGSQALVNGDWITPRQFTSPRAALRSTQIQTIKCLPADLEQTPLCFEAVNGDQLWCEKIGNFQPTTTTEDCNLTGLAFSVVSLASNSVILLPGDAPIHKVPHYRNHRSRGLHLRGLVAYHHGARTHGVEETVKFLRHWTDQRPAPEIVFSCGAPNAYGHPWPGYYLEALPAASLYRPQAGSSAICFS